MKIAPYVIRKFTLKKTLDGDRYGVDYRQQSSVPDNQFPGYYVKSTAPFNTDTLSAQEKQYLALYAKPQQAKDEIQAIAQKLHDIQRQAGQVGLPELVIAVHGYNMSETTVLDWYNNIYRYISKDDEAISQRKNVVFMGYRWSSESMSVSPFQLIPVLWRNAEALPDLLRWLVVASLVLVLRYLMWPFVKYDWQAVWSAIRRGLEATATSRDVGSLVVTLSEQGSVQVIWDLLGRLGIGVMFFVLFTIVALILLRMFVYFRDIYRAMNFAVPDLTELIRQLDQELANLQESCGEDGTPLEKVKLTFLGHSMGSFVITNTVRVLSDVFDSRSIAQKPVPEIGRMLSLGRLVLASPDIPVLSIVSSRANGLASSLRRFDESYLFSNEGDLALRLASMAANYIFFPSAKDEHGHRLGSIALANRVWARQPLAKRGIINLETLGRYYPREVPLGEAITNDNLDILQCLFITRSIPRVRDVWRNIFSRKRHKKNDYVFLKGLFERDGESVTIADLFTFFDCTDYKDTRLKIEPDGMYSSSDKVAGVLTLAKGKSCLRFFDYCLLLLAWQRGKCDVHGGYFQGNYSRELIYRIAFLGFEGMLKANAAGKCANSDSEASKMSVMPEEALQKLSKDCLDKGIQVYLSPLRYRVDIQGVPIKEAKKELLQTVQSDPLAVDM